MIIEKYTQQSDLTKPTGVIKTTYTVEPETPKEKMEFENFINYNKIPKTTLANFEQKTSSDISPETLKSICEKAAMESANGEEAALRKILEDHLGCPLPEAGTLYLTGKPKIPDYRLCQCLVCREERGEF